MKRISLASFLVFALFAHRASATTREVGSGKTYATPCAAIAAAQAGDVVEVAAGSYPGDHCSWSTDNLTIRGVGGRAVIDAGKNTANIAEQKGIFVIYADNATIENFELAGAYVGGGSKNAAGIRHQGTNLTVRNCWFHDDEDGILGSPKVSGTGKVVIENSELSANGHGDGQSHNLYLGDYASFRITGSYSHDANAGHLLKSRALDNFVAYNRFDDGASTNVSYEVSFPSAGRAFVLGNLIRQNVSTDGNSGIIDYASEGATNPSHALYVINDTIVNERTNGSTAVVNHSTQPTVITNTIFVGAGSLTNQADAVLTTNFTGDPGFVSASDWHLALGSACIDHGTDPGTIDGVAATPAAEYTGLATIPRSSLGTIDIGAYEYGNPGAANADDAGASGADGGSGGGSGNDDGVTTPVKTDNGATSTNDSGCALASPALASGSSAFVGAAAATLGLALLRRRRARRG